MIGMFFGYTAGLWCLWRANDDRLSDGDGAIFLICGLGMFVAGTWPAIRWVMAWTS